MLTTKTQRHEEKHEGVKSDCEEIGKLIFADLH
jgi:hypothetical protein